MRPKARIFYVQQEKYSEEKSNQPRNFCNLENQKRKWKNGILRACNIVRVHTSD